MDTPKYETLFYDLQKFTTMIENISQKGTKKHEKNWCVLGIPGPSFTIARPHHFFPKNLTMVNGNLATLLFTFVQTPAQK